MEEPVVDKVGREKRVKEEISEEVKRNREGFVGNVVEKAKEIWG